MRRENAEASEAGFTLLELSISLCIVGLLMSGAMAGVTRYIEAQRNLETQQRIDFAIDMLSGYVQTHYRLPCPADEKATGDQAGREMKDGQCYTESTELSGVLPWRELALPEAMARDGWGRYIAYKPASHSTIDTLAPSMKGAVATADVPASCRTAGWYDADGNHLNRAKALFCCNAEPRPPELNPELLANGDSAETLASLEPAAGGNMPEKPAPVTKGSFSDPYYMSGFASPLLRSTAPAVTLSGGPAGRGQFVLALRSDQLFARTGSASCEAPPPAIIKSYSCVAQDFHTDNAPRTERDSDTGEMLPVPTPYGVSIALAGNHYKLRLALTKESSLSRDDSLGFYLVNGSGKITAVNLLMPSAGNWQKGETRDFSVDFANDTTAMGFFVIPDGYKLTRGYKDIDLSHLMFVVNYSQQNERPATIRDHQPPVLVSIDKAGFETAVTGHDVIAYHIYGNLNPLGESRILRHDSVCRIAGDKVGPNGFISCGDASVVPDAGVNPARPNIAQIAFEESDSVRCYETKSGACQKKSGAAPEDLLNDGEGGYIASIGDNKYADLAFAVGLAACPQSP